MRQTIALLITAAFAFPVTALAAGTSAESAPDPSGSPFASAAGCFKDTPDYASWLNSVPAVINGQELPKDRLKQAVPERAFEFARATFDCHVVSYESGGHTVSGYVVQPKRPPASGKRPLLVYNRGGNGSFGRIESLQVFRDLMPLAKAGYTVVASQYRGSAGGEDARIGVDEFGGKDVGDVMRLIDLSLTLPGVDADNIFMLGASRGGMMNYLVARQRRDITAMATIAAPTDLGAGLKWRPEMERVYSALIPGYASDKKAALSSRSALLWVEQLPEDLPVLALHGDADDRVNVRDSRAIAERLKELGRPHKLVVYPGDNHGLQQNRMAARQEILDWFSQHTK